MAQDSKSTISLELKNPLLLVFLFIAITIIILELGVIEKNPIAFGDGAYHAYIAKYIGSNQIYPKVLPNLNNYYTYSPLLHVLLSVFYMTPFGEILAKAFIPIVVFITGMAIFVTVSRAFSRKAAFLAAVFTITIPIFVTYSVLIYTDMLMILFFSLSTMFTLIAEKDGQKKYWILAVIFGALSFLSKGIGIISFGFVGFVLLYKLLKKEYTIRRFSELIFIVGVVAVLAVGGWIIRNSVFFDSIDCNLPLPKGNCVLQMSDPKIFEKFEGYVTPSGSNVGVLNFGLKDFILFMYGSTAHAQTLWLVPLAVIIGVILLISRREKIDYFNLVLLFLSILPALAISVIGFQTGVDVRTEDVARYMILSAFAVPLIAAVFVDKFLESVKKYWKYLTLVFVIIIVFVSWLNFKDKLDTMSSVTQFSPSFFEACNFIKANTETNAKFLTLWAAPTIYNCERAAGWESDQLPDIVLSQNLTTVLDALKVQNISYIFIQKFSLSQTPYQASIPVSFVQFLDNNPDHFKNIYENGPTLENCISQGGCDGTIVYKLVSS